MPLLALPGVFFEMFYLFSGCGDLEATFCGGCLDAAACTAQPVTMAVLFLLYETINAG